MNSSINWFYSNNSDTTTAWVLNDDDSNRAWMDEELALHRQQQQQAQGLTSSSRSIDTSEVLVNQQLSKTDSEGSYQRKFGKKRRPSLSGGRTKTKNKSTKYSAPLDCDNDDDNNTISTLSSTSLLLDDRDATASSSSPREESSGQVFRIVRHDDERAGEEIDRVVENML